MSSSLNHWDRVARVHHTSCSLFAMLASLDRFCSASPKEKAHGSEKVKKSVLLYIGRSTRCCNEIEI